MTDRIHPPPPPITETALTVKAGAMLIICATFIVGAIVWGLNSIMNHETRITAVETTIKSFGPCFDELKSDGKETRRTVQSVAELLARHDAASKAGKIRGEK